MSCTSDDITCAIRELTKAVQHSGSGLDVATFVFVVIGTIGSLLVGIAALVASWRATQIANSAQQGAYETGLDTALGQFFAASGDYLVELRQWLVTPPQLTQAGLVFRPLPPRASQATALFEASRLRAQGDDATTLTVLAQWWHLVSEGTPERRSAGIEAMLQAIREWRSGTLDHDAIRGFAEKVLRGQEAEAPDQEPSAG